MRIKRFFQRDLKKYGQRMFFQNNQKKRYFLEMLIALQIWVKYKFFQSDLKKLYFPRNLNFFGGIGEKRFFQSDLKKSLFC